MTLVTLGLGWGKEMGLGWGRWVYGSVTTSKGFEHGLMLVHSWCEAHLTGMVRHLFR